MGIGGLRCGGGKGNTIYCVLGSKYLFNIVTRHKLPVVEQMEPKYMEAAEGSAI